MKVEEQELARCSLRQFLKSANPNLEFFKDGLKLIVKRIEVHRVFLKEELGDSQHRAVVDVTLYIANENKTEKEQRCDIELTIIVENCKVVNIRDGRANVIMDDHEVFHIIKEIEYNEIRERGLYKTVGYALLDRGLESEEHVFFKVSDDKVRLRDSKGIHEDFSEFLNVIGLTWQKIEIRYSND